MYRKILLLITLAIVSGFFYLDQINDTTARIVLDETHFYELPIVVLLFIAFASGMIISLINSFIIDAKRFVRDMNAKRHAKVLKSSREHHVAGTDYLMRDNLKKSVSSLTKATEADPENLDIVIKLAEAYCESGNMEDTFKLLEGAIIKNPSNLELKFSIVEYMLSVDDVVKAKKVLNEILELDSSNATALVGLRNMAADDGQWKDAYRFGELLINSNAYTTELDSKGLKAEKEILAGYLYESAKEFFEDNELSRAKELVKKSLKRSTDFVPSLLLLGGVYESEGRSEKAVELYKASYNKLRFTVFLLKLEELFISNDSPDEALQIYSRALADDEKNVSLRLLNSRLMLKLAMSDDALNLLEDTTTECDSAFYHSLLAEAYSEKGDKDNAITHLRLALGSDKDLTPPFECSVCGNEVEGYKSKCGSCENWNTFIIKDKNVKVVNDKISSSPVYEDSSQEENTPEVKLH